MNFHVCLALMLCVILFCIGTTQGDEEFDGQLTVQLQHSFDPGPTFEYTDRDSITFRPLKPSKFRMPTEIELTKNDQAKLIKLLDKDGFYRIRVPIKVNDSITYLYTFIRACSLYESGLSDILTLHTSVNGELLGISATASQTLCQGNHVPDALLQYFDTVIEIRPTETGPVPDTAAFVQKVEKEKADRAKNEQGDNRSFFAKYWMYIVPVVVFMFISQIFTPDPQGGGR